MALYPLDTLKTRLQSQYGFWNSGGFKGIYKGIGPTSIGSPLSGIMHPIANTHSVSITYNKSIECLAKAK